MRIFFKWFGIVVLCLIVIVLVAALLLANKQNKIAGKTYEVSLPSIPIPTDSASFVRGGVIAASLCSGCHGGDFAGADFINDPKLVVIAATNITSGGKTNDYTDADWIRIIRYGVKPDNHGAIIMPSSEMGKMSDADLGSLISYMKNVPASSKTWPEPMFTFMSKVMAGAGLFGVIYHAEIIALTDTKTITAPEPGPTIDYGKYTVGFHGCTYCHGDNLNGKFTGDPVAPPGANITVAGNFGKWSLQQFKETLRTGTTPEGKVMDTKFMPWASIGQMTDMELEAVYNYLKSVPGEEDIPKLKKYKEKHASL